MARCASASASMPYAPRCSSILRTTLFPVAMLPVRPITYFPGQRLKAESPAAKSWGRFYAGSGGLLKPCSPPELSEVHLVLDGQEDIVRWAERDGAGKLIEVLGRADLPLIDQAHAVEVDAFAERIQEVERRLRWSTVDHLHGRGAGDLGARLDARPVVLELQVGLTVHPDVHPSAGVVLHGPSAALHVAVGQEDQKMVLGQGDVNGAGEVQRLLGEVQLWALGE